MKARVLYAGPIEAPIAEGQKLGDAARRGPGQGPGRLRPRRRRRGAARRADDPDQRRGAADPRPRRSPTCPVRRRAEQLRTAWPGGASSASRGSTARASRRRSARLAAHLRAEGASVVETREPGGSPGAEQIRRLLVEGDPGRWSPETEILLFTAARRDHLERTIRPALAAGATVLCDRFAEFDPRLPERRPRRPARHGRRRCTRCAIGVEPDLHADPRPRSRSGLARGLARGGREDRFERLGAGFQARLRAAFLALPPSSPTAAASSPPAATAAVVASRIACGGIMSETGRARPPPGSAAPAGDRGALRPGGGRARPSSRPKLPAGCTTPGC